MIANNALSKIPAGGEAGQIISGKLFLASLGLSELRATAARQDPKLFFRVIFQVFSMSVLLTDANFFLTDSNVMLTDTLSVLTVQY